MKKFFKGPVLFVLIGFAIGLLYFFPITIIKNQVISEIEKASGLIIDAQNLRISTGIGLGLGRGGVLALKGDNTSIQSGRISFQCNEITASPHILPLFWGQLKLGFECSGKRKGSIEGDLAMKIFGEKSADAHVDLKEFDLSQLSDLMPSFPLQAKALGSVEILGINADARKPPEVKWKLALQDTVIPSVSSMLLNIPAIPLKNVDTQGSFKKGNLSITNFKFGNKETPISGDITVDLELDPRFLPIDGAIKGTIKSDPVWEKTVPELSLNDFFCHPGEGGVRKFEKRANRGQPQSLIFSKRCG